MAPTGRWLYEVDDEFWDTLDNSSNDNAEDTVRDPFGPVWRAAAARAARGLGPGYIHNASNSQSGTQAPTNNPSVHDASSSQSGTQPPTNNPSVHDASNSQSGTQPPTNNPSVHVPQPLTSWVSQYDSHHDVPNNLLIRVPQNGSRPVAAPGTSSGHTNESSGGTNQGGQPESLADRAHWSGPFGPFWYRHSDGAVALDCEALKHIWDPTNPQIGYHEAGPAQNYPDNPLANTPAIETGPHYLGNTATNMPALEDTNTQPIGMASSAGAANFSLHTAGSNSTANSVGTASLQTNSSEYRGDPNIPENMSADIPEDENTSLYVCGMGPDTGARDILGAIRGVGKIYTLYVNPPSETHKGAAAKISFFTRAAAQKFFDETRNGFQVMGYSATVRWNRIRVREQTILKDGSRVIVIRGPKHIVNNSVISDVINRNIRFYELESVRVEPHSQIEGLVEMYVHFACFRAQAHSAFILLNREFRGRVSGFSISYGADPCEGP